MRKLFILVLCSYFLHANSTSGKAELSSLLPCLPSHFATIPETPQTPSPLAFDGKGFPPDFVLRGGSIVPSTVQPYTTNIAGAMEGDRERGGEDLLSAPTAVPAVASTLCQTTITEEPVTNRERSELSEVLI